MANLVSNKRQFNFPQMGMHSVDSTKSGENPKNPAAKCYSQWELNPGSLTFMSCMLLSELIPYLLGSIHLGVIFYYWIFFVFSWFYTILQNASLFRENANISVLCVLFTHLMLLRKKWKKCPLCELWVFRKESLNNDVFPLLSIGWNPNITLLFPYLQTLYDEPDQVMIISPLPITSVAPEVHEGFSIIVNGILSKISKISALEPVLAQGRWRMNCWRQQYL